MSASDKIEIRAGRSDERDEAYRVWRSAVDATHGFLTPGDLAEIDQMVREEFFPKVDFWVAVDGSQRVRGFLVMDGDMIDALFVAPEAHGQGIGTMLVDHAATLAGPRLRVEASEQADNALPFYLARGFRVVGRSELDHQGRPYPLVELVRE